MGSPQAVYVHMHTVSPVSFLLQVYGVPELASLWFTRAIPVLRVHHGNHGKDIREMLAYIEEHGIECLLDAVLPPKIPVRLYLPSWNGWCLGSK